MQPTQADLTALATIAPAPTSPAVVYLARLSKRSQVTMRGALERAGEMLLPGHGALIPWESVRYEHVQALRARLAAEVGPSWTNVVLSAVKGVAREAWKLGLTDGDDYQRIKSVEGVKGSRVTRGRAAETAELQALLAACDPAKRDQPGEKILATRDRAILAVMIGGGLRRAEVSELQVTAYDPKERGLRVLGKGNRERVVYLAPDFASYLESWIHARGPEEGPLFRLSDKGVYVVVMKRVRETGLASLTPHDFRRTMISRLLDVGTDIATVQAIAGHQDPRTSIRYDRRGDQRKKAAAESLSLEESGMP